MLGRARGERAGVSWPQTGGANAVLGSLCPLAPTIGAHGAHGLPGQTGFVLAWKRRGRDQRCLCGLRAESTGL